MRRHRRSGVCVALLALALTPMAGAQPERLDEMIEVAMAHNPDVLRAQAALHQAEVELNAVRLRVAREVAELHLERRGLHEALGRAEERAGQVAEQVEAGARPQGEVLAAHREVMEIDLQLNRLEAAVRYTLGIGGMPEGPPPHEMHAEEADIVMRQRPGLPEGRMRELLQQRVTLEFEDIRLAELFEFIRETWDINIALDMDLADLRVLYLKMGDVPMEACLRALSDMQAPLCFVVRDYGLFGTTRDRAMRIDAPTIPDDIPLLVPAGQALPHSEYEAVREGPPRMDLRPSHPR